jgi:hypothetical protein
MLLVEVTNPPELSRSAHREALEPLEPCLEAYARDRMSARPSGRNRWRHSSASRCLHTGERMHMASRLRAERLFLEVRDFAYSAECGRTSTHTPMLTRACITHAKHPCLDTRSVRAQTHTQTHARMHARTRADAHACVRARAHARARTHTHVHAHHTHAHAGAAARTHTLGAKPPSQTFPRRTRPCLGPVRSRSPARARARARAAD